MYDLGFLWFAFFALGFNFVQHLVWLLLYYYVVVCLSDEELDNRNGREQLVELDSLDTEKALLLTDDDDPLWV